MVFITMNHYSGGEFWNLTNVSLKSVLAYMLYRPLGQVGVDLFVLITGYFMSERIDTDYVKSLKRASKIWLEV